MGFSSFSIGIMAVPVMGSTIPEVQIIDSIAQIPDRCLEACRPQVQAGTDYILDRVDARIEGLPVLISVGAFTSGILGAFVGSFIVLFLFKNTILRLLRQISAVRKDLKEFKGRSK